MSRRLLDQLSAPQKPKTAYQSYTLQHGIERLTVLVPLSEAVKFEQQFDALADRSKGTITKLIESVGGKVRG